MAFPADGMERTFRNDISKVAALMHERHRGHFLVLNLSGRTYDYSKLGSRVVDWCSFPDHHAPPLALMFRICNAIYECALATVSNQLTHSGV
jgi:hypothetical protein